LNSVDKIKEYFNNLPEVKRIHELEGYIDNNPKINELFDKLKDIQKKMVNAREFNQMNQYKVYKDEYEKIKMELNEIPFYEEYIELLEIVDNMLVNFTSDIEYELNKKINR
jgi:cell fate (sporulation/competence/biofilm development) regulator YmcA (YheA/YmcA/DUF963 family)